jgi:hypothetical protein
MLLTLKQRYEEYRVLCVRKDSSELKAPRPINRKERRGVKYQNIIHTVKEKEQAAETTLRIAEIYVTP